MHFASTVTCMLPQHALHMTITLMLHVQANMHVKSSNMHVTCAGSRIGTVCHQLKFNTCASMILIFDIARFKPLQNQLRVVSPSLMNS